MFFSLNCFMVFFLLFMCFFYGLLVLFLFWNVSLLLLSGLCYFKMLLSWSIWFIGSFSY